MKKRRQIAQKCPIRGNIISNCPAVVGFTGENHYLCRGLQGWFFGVAPFLAISRLKTCQNWHVWTVNAAYVCKTPLPSIFFHFFYYIVIQTLHLYARFSLIEPPLYALLSHIWATEKVLFTPKRQKNCPRVERGGGEVLLTPSPLKKTSPPRLRAPRFLFACLFIGGLLGWGAPPASFIHKQPPCIASLQSCLFHRSFVLPYTKTNYFSFYSRSLNPWPNTA